VVVVDACHVTFLDSAGIGAFVALHHLASSQGAMLPLVVTPDSVPQQVLQMGQIAESIPFYSERDEAVRAG
jgi:anti-anti-sigma regulatory factor